MKIALNKKILTSIMIIFTLLFVLSPTNVKAVLQSKDGTASKKNMAEWMLQIRQMQSAGGTLGLGDVIDTTALTSNNKNLDIHMEKNTEYGALIILSASSYGNPNVIADGQTTTGNQTGAVMKINKEKVAAVSSNGASAYPNRYINKNYGTSGGVYKSGDAMNVGNWHGSSATTWFNIGQYNSQNGCLVRGWSGSIFSYYGYATYDGSENEAHVRSHHASRAAIVIGSGI